MRFATAMTVASDNCKFNSFEEGYATSYRLYAVAHSTCQIHVRTVKSESLMRTSNTVQLLALYYKYIHFYHTIRGAKLPTSANMTVYT
jgi:hypothetical protein